MERDGPAWNEATKASQLSALLSLTEIQNLRVQLSSLSKYLKKVSGSLRQATTKKKSGKCAIRPKPLGTGTAKQGKLTPFHPNDLCEPLLNMKNMRSNDAQTKNCDASKRYQTEKPCSCGIPLRAECGKLYHFEHECRCKVQQTEYKPYTRPAGNRDKVTKKTNIGAIYPCEDRPKAFGTANAQQGKLIPFHPNDKCESLLYMRNVSTNSSVSTLSCDDLGIEQKKSKTSCQYWACLKQNKKDNRRANNNHKGNKPYLSPSKEQPQIFSTISCSPYAGPHRKLNTKPYSENNRNSSRKRPKTSIRPICREEEALNDGPMLAGPCICSFCQREMQANNQYANDCKLTLSDKEKQLPVRKAGDCTCLKCISQTPQTTASYSRASSVITYSSHSRAAFEFKATTRAQSPGFSLCASAPSSNRSLSCICDSVCTVVSTTYSEVSSHACRHLPATKPTFPTRQAVSRRSACHECKSEPVISLSSCDRPYNYDTDEINELCRCETPAYSLSIKPPRSPRQLRSAKTASKNLEQKKCACPYCSKQDSIEICSCEQCAPSKCVPKTSFPAQKQTTIHSYESSATQILQQRDYTRPYNSSITAYPSNSTYGRSYTEQDCECGSWPDNKVRVCGPDTKRILTSERVTTKSPDPFKKAINDCGPCECSSADEVCVEDANLKSASQAPSCLCINCKCARRPPSPNKELKEVCLCDVCKCEIKASSSKPKGPHPVQCLCAECICPDEVDHYVRQYTSRGEVCRPPSATSFQSERIEKCPCPDCPKYIATEGGHHVKRVCSDRSKKSTQSNASYKTVVSKKSTKTEEVWSELCSCSEIFSCESEVADVDLKKMSPPFLVKVPSEENHGIFSNCQDVGNEDVEHQDECSGMIQERSDQTECMNELQIANENSSEIAAEKQLNEKEETLSDVCSCAQYAGGAPLKDEPCSCSECRKLLNSNESSISGPCSCSTESNICSCSTDVTQSCSSPEPEPTTSTLYSSVFSGASCSGECVKEAAAESSSSSCECSIPFTKSPSPTVSPVESIKSEPKVEVVEKPVCKEPVSVCPNNCGCDDCPFLNPKPEPIVLSKRCPPCLPPIPSAMMPRQKPDLSCSEALDQIRNIVCFGPSSERCECRCTCQQPTIQMPRVPRIFCEPPPRCICFPAKQTRRCEEGAFGSRNLTPGPGHGSTYGELNKTLKAVAKVGAEYLDKATRYENNDDELLGINTGLNSLFGFLFSEIKNIKDMLNCGLQKIDAKPCDTAPPAIEYRPNDFVTVPPLPAVEPSTGPAFVKTLPPGCCIPQPPCTCLTPVVTITGVQSVGSKSLLITWKVDHCRGVVGYEVYVDGCLKSRSYSPGRTCAVAYNVDLGVKHVVTVVAVVDETLNTFGLSPTQSSFCYQPISRPSTILDCFT